MNHVATRLLLLGVCLGLAACGDDTAAATDSGAAPAKDAGPVNRPVQPPDYAMVSLILGGPEQAGIGSCAASSCHASDGAGKAHLNFKTAKDLTEVLVNVPACENTKLMRVKPGNPEESWLWIKLTGAIQDKTEGKLVYAGTPSTCSSVATGFGSRMPYAAGSFDKLSAAKLAIIHDWIVGGAPGPDGVANMDDAGGAAARDE